VLKLLALPAMLTTLAGSTPTQMQLSARWLPLRQVALHIRGRLTNAGRPVAAQPITLSASGRGTTRVIGRTSTATDGSFGLHYRVVALADWRDASTRRALEQRFRWVIASFRGNHRLAAARLRVAVAPP
jgi:hypothetical protein